MISVTCTGSATVALPGSLEAEEWESHRQDVLRSIRFHIRQKRRDEGRPTLELHDDRQG